MRDRISEGEGKEEGMESMEEEEGAGGEEGKEEGRRVVREGAGGGRCTVHRVCKVHWMVWQAFLP